MVTAPAHGNEIGGAIVLDELFRAGIRPPHGTLTLVFCNVAAFERLDPAQPEVSRWVEEEFNRLWTAEVLDGPRDTAPTCAARASSARCWTAPTRCSNPCSSAAASAARAS